jgi:hypothetical protein
MLSLDSPRWKELRHAYGSAEHVPELIRAMTAESVPRYSDHPAKARSNPTPWDEVYSSLCHQGSAYSATYAALPHIVDIALRDGVSMRAATMVLAGTILIHNNPDNVPDDLAAGFEKAIASIREVSLTTVRTATLDYPGTLSHLLQAFGALRFPRSVHVRSLDCLYEGNWEVEIDYCPKCRKDIFVEMAEDGPVSMPVDNRGLPIKESATHTVADRFRYPDHIEQGSSILKQGADPYWREIETSSVLAALAKERGDSVLSTRILDLDANVTCPHCDFAFRLSDALGIAPDGD